MTQTCGRCGTTADLLGGYANGMDLCHINTDARPTCYEIETNTFRMMRLVTGTAAMLAGDLHFASVGPAVTRDELARVIDPWAFEPITAPANCDLERQKEVAQRTAQTQAHFVLARFAVHHLPEGNNTDEPQ